MQSASQILQNHRITTKSTASGRYYAICPLCSSKRKQAHQKLKCLGVTIGSEGVKFGCNHCQWQGGEFYENRERSIRVPPSQPIPTPHATPEPSELSRIAQAKRMWSGGRDPRGTLAERYLNSRGLELTDDIASRVVRFDSASPWKNENEEVEFRPVMLTAFRSIADDRLVAVHRTLLSDDGRKLNRRMLGPVGGAAVKISADEDVEQGLSICEGFETGLAAGMLGFRPIWSLGSAGAIGAFPVLAGIDALTIMGETDDSGDNAQNARTCARAWVTAGREASIVVPGVPGDMNDLVKP